MAKVQIIFPAGSDGAVHPLPIVNDEIVSVVQGHVIMWEVVSHNADIREVTIEFEKPDPAVAEKIDDPGARLAMRQGLERAAAHELENPQRRNFFLLGEGPKAEPSPAGRVPLRFASDGRGQGPDPGVGRGVLWGLAPFQPEASYESDRYKYTVFAYGADGQLLVAKDPEVISHRPSGGTNVTPSEP